jgi:amidophosphoribosyltransferase
MLLLQQHRGEKSVGIVSSHDHNLFFRKRMGRVYEQFDKNYDFSELPGKVAIGHNRYATKGASDDKSNIQPLVFRDSKYGQFAVAHNGTLSNIDDIKARLIKGGALFQSTTDSEVLAHLISQSKKKTIEDAILSELADIHPSYSLFVFTPNQLFAVRDKYGVRPLSVARLKEGYLVASETCAFRMFDDSEYLRDVRPGEMVIFNKSTIKTSDGFKSIKFADSKESFCSFECIYFSDPRSEYNGFMHEDFRFLCGEKVYTENKDLFNSLRNEGSLIVPILDSGKHGARGLSNASGIPYKEIFQRRHNTPTGQGRSYTSSSDWEREYVAMMKLDLRREEIKDKTVISVDDSNVRGKTATINNQRLRRAGAKRIINVFMSPMISEPCYYGMDHQTHDELIASNYKTLDAIAENIGSDLAIYISLQGLKDTFKQTYNCGICTGCFGGEYPK